jgi:hypothetical protein
MSRLARLLSVALLTTAEHGAAADAGTAPPTTLEPYANGHRFTLATAIGNGFTDVSTSGRHYQESALVRGALEAGYGYPFPGSIWGIHALLRIEGLNTDFAESVGEGRAAVDFGVGPELRLQTRGRRPNVQWRLALPLGFTRVYMSGASGRAVEATNTDGNGFQMAAIGGVDLAGLHYGGYIQLEYVLRVFGSTRTSVSQQEPFVTAHDDFDFVDHSFLIVTGVLFRP